MTHLLAISVGPVQEFIAAARRTRDLWFGSYVLSEISRAAAAEVAKEGQLIFPASSAVKNVANKILAEVNDPKAAADRARREARACWEEHARQALDELGRYPVKVIVPGIWDEQLPDVIEFFAAWVARTSDYREDRKRVERLLAGRKYCKDFLRAKGRAGVQKSSLDGQRESVLLQAPRGVDRKTFRDDWPNILRLSSGEQLDVVGVAKRLGKKKGENNPPFPSVARIAAESWLQGVRKAKKIDRLKAACESLADKGLHKVQGDNEDNYGYFPYEGTIIYKDRHADLREELGLGEQDLDEVAGILKDIGGEPGPYLAVLVADGDKMGEAISNLDSVEKHRAFSQALAGFADEARSIVSAHNGVAIYAGGDDVLAFLPVDKCLACARGLHDKFADVLSKFGSLTLSVGLAIGHFMEDLEDLRDYGRQAEKAAKAVQGKDALAVHLHKRGGAPIEVRAKWTEKPDERLIKFANLMKDGTIPSKLPYELRAMAMLYESWTANANEAIRQDVVRLIAKKSSKGVETVKKSLDDYIQDLDAPKLLALAQELLVARQIAAALRQAQGHSVEITEAAS